jgi:hypothetical protein
LAIAVVVQAIAGFSGRVERRAILVIIRRACEPDTVHTTGSRFQYAGTHALLQFAGHKHQCGIIRIDQPIAIVVDTIAKLRATDPFIDLPIAVVIDSVARFRGSWVNADDIIIAVTACCPAITIIVKQANASDELGQTSAVLKATDTIGIQCAETTIAMTIGIITGQVLHSAILTGTTYAKRAIGK